MPKDVAFDGEFWMGRNSFKQLNNLVNTRRSDVEDEFSDEWRTVNYMIFDLPNSQQSIEQRIEDTLVIKLPEHAKIAVKIQCQGTRHLEEYLNVIVEEEGEGIMAQRPGSKYQIGRTGDILKVKVRPCD